MNIYNILLRKCNLELLCWFCDSFISYIIGAFGVLRWIYSQIDCPIDLSTEYTEATERFVIPLREYNLELMS